MIVQDVNSKQWADELLACFRKFNIDALDVFKVVSAIMLLSNVEFKMSGSTPVVANDTVMQKISSLLGLDQAQITRAICEPTMTIGNETTKIGQDVAQCLASTATMARSIYEQLFLHLVRKINTCTSSVIFH